MSTITVRVKTGFHYGAGENVLNGWSEWWQKLHQAGLPANAIGADNSGPLVEIANSNFNGDVLIWRRSLPHNGFDPNNPNYNNEPTAEAERMYNYKYDILWPRNPNTGVYDLDPTKAFLKDTNEIRTKLGEDDTMWNNLAPGEWWGRYALRFAELAVRDNHRVVLLNPSSGDHDAEFWDQPSMLTFLAYAAAHRHNVVVGLHEYSYVPYNLFALVGNDDATVDQVLTSEFWQRKIGRFIWLYDICDQYGIDWPSLYFPEWGWSLNQMPDTEAAIQQIYLATEKIYGPYDKYILGFGTWYLGISPRFGRKIAEQTNSLLLPTADIAINMPLEVEEKIPNGNGTTPPPPDDEIAVINWSFENGWTDLPPVQGDLINQKPNDWAISWLDIGQTGYAINQKTGQYPTIATIPECLHKLASQLPPNEQPGGPDALILDGKHVYKMFARGGPWSAQLMQTISGLKPSALIKVQWPVQVHYQDVLNEDSPDDIEIWLGVGQDLYKFFAIPDLPDREWVILEGEGYTDNMGTVDIGISIQTKWANNRDVFTDAVTAVYVEDNIDPPPNKDCGVTPTIKRTVHLLPQDITLEEEQSIVKEFHANKNSFVFSHDDAMRIQLAGDPDRSIVYVWEPERRNPADLTVMDACGVMWEARYFEGTPPPPEEFAFTHWPTPHKVITQEFLANPQNYNQYGLPGHDGIDIRAYHGDNVMAVADGIVSDVIPLSANHNYGLAIRVSHAESYETTYAHLKQVIRSVGEKVKGGDIIGLADNTGNSFGDHLHLTLKQKGVVFTDRCGNVWNYNICDPTPFMTHFTGVTWPGGAPGFDCPGVEPPPDTVNLTPYFMGSGAQYQRLFEVETKVNGQSRGQQRHQNQVWHGRLYFCKGGDGAAAPCQWEELRVASGKIQRWRDFSFSATDYYDVGNTFVDWMKSEMAEGEIFTSHAQISHYQKSDCRKWAGPSATTDYLKFFKRHATWEGYNGIVLSDVIEVHWSKSSTFNVIEEIYFFSSDSRASGLVGWKNERDGRDARVSELHEPGQRPNSVIMQPACLPNKPMDNW